MASIQSYIVRFLLSRSSIWNKPLQDVRKSMESIKAKGIPAGINVRTEDVNGVPCKVFECSENKTHRIMLYFHGGGFCLGIYNANSEFGAGLAKRAGTRCYMPDYRLAPESPFPAALEDAIAVYKGLLSKGHDVEDIIIAGDSSGCALAVSALLVLKQSGVKMPRALVFMTPVFDLAGTGETFSTGATKDPFRLADPLGIAKIYTGSNNPSSPMISPLFGDLEGLPPVLIHAADYDVFLSDSYRFKEKAKASGVEVHLKVWKTMWHIFHMQAPFVPESSAALDEICAYIRGQ